MGEETPTAEAAAHIYRLTARETLLSTSDMGCNGKTSTAPVAMGAPHLLPLYGP